MQITVKNCNNIENGIINIEEGNLNIKYGINGTGKSTISKAIKFGIENEDMTELKPFNSNDDIYPSITGIEQFNKLKIYNEEYVAQYLFLPSGNELHQNSFEVFIKPNNYEEGIENINSILSIVKDFVIQNELINQLIMQKNDLAKILKLNTNKTSINATGVGKALNSGNKIINIPESLNSFSPFLNGENKANWFGWQTEGRKYIQEDKCPFCTRILSGSFNKLLEVLDSLFDKKNVEALIKTGNIVNEISNTMSEQTNEFLNNVLNNENPISNEDKEKLARFMVELDSICAKLYYFVQLDYSTLKSVEDLQQQLVSAKITVDDIEFFNGEEFLNLIDELNTKIDEMLVNIQYLRQTIGELNTMIRNYATNNKTRINEFLDTVGMKYEVNVKDNKLFLFYKGSEILVDAKNHLSWGEKNAFALSLFLFDCLHENPNLIILDDPVSSFDFNKKFAINHYLFNTSNSLKDKTVLMLTHDLEPVIDMLKVKTYPNVKCYFLTNNRGLITEQVINENDIHSIISVTKQNFMAENINIINRLIHYRRYLELNVDNCEFEYNMVSSLLKGYDVPRYIDRINRIDRNFTTEEIIQTSEKIKIYLENFDYNNIKDNIKNKQFMKKLYLDTDNSYEKIEIFRIILKAFGLLNVNPVIEKLRV